MSRFDSGGLSCAPDSDVGAQLRLVTWKVFFRTRLRCVFFIPPLQLQHCVMRLDVGAVVVRIGF